jgi:RNA polymerase sigma factor (sigma-70 family)
MALRPVRAQRHVLSGFRRGLQRIPSPRHRKGMTADTRSDKELLIGLPRQPELMGVRPQAQGVTDDLGMDWDAVDARLDARAECGRLRSALDGLSDSDRELLLLVAWEGLSHAEAAAALGISPVAARSRLHRARMRALKALQKLQSGMPGGPDVTTTLYAGEQAS